MPDPISSSATAPSKRSYRKLVGEPTTGAGAKHFDVNAAAFHCESTPVKKASAFSVQYANRRGALPKPHPTLDIRQQRQIMQQRTADSNATTAYYHATNSRLKPAEARHALCQLVVESHRWRAAVKRSPTAGKPSTFVQPTFSKQQPNKAPAAIMDVTLNRKDFHGLLSDIDVLMTNPVVVESGDAKNTYQKILVNLSQLGIFRSGQCH